MTTVSMAGLSTDIKVSACTTSGQLWQERDMNTSNRSGPCRPRMVSRVASSALGG